MLSINLDLLPMKAHYFLYNAGTAPVVPYIPTLAKQLGFSSVVVGALYTALPVMGMLVKPTMGALADRYHCQKLVFLAAIVLTIVTFFPLLYVPALPEASVSAQLHCHEESNLRVCGVGAEVASRLTAEGLGNRTLPCTFSCQFGAGFTEAACRHWNWSGAELCGVEQQKPTSKSVTFNSLLSPWHTLAIKNEDCLYTRVTKVKKMEFGPEWHVAYCDTLQVAECQALCDSVTLESLATVSDSQVVQYYQFWMFVLLLVLSWIGMAIIVSVGDAICFSILGEEPGRFGKQRLWGSVGFGLFVVLAGWLVDVWSVGKTNKDYTPVFYMMAGMLALDFIASSRLKYTQRNQSPSIVRNVGKLFLDIKIVVFLLWLVVVGMCTALIWNFLFWYLEELAEEFGSSSTQQWIKTLEGLVNGVQSFGGELPFFFLSGWILKKIGHVHAMSLVLFAFGVRFLLYSLLRDPWWCLPIELLNGLTYGLLYATMASYASLVAPPGTDTTVQGLVGAIFEGIGVSTGSFLAGIMFSQTSGATVFRIAGLAVLVFCVLHICVQFFLGRRSSLHISQSKDFNGGAHYASPNEAIHMLDEPSYELLT